MSWDFFLEYKTLTDTLKAICIFLLFLLFRNLFSKYVFKFILKISKKTPTEFFTNVWLSFEKPIRWFFVVIGIYLAAQFIPYFNPNNALFLKIYRSTIILLITWGFYNLSSTSSVIFQKLNSRYDLEIDQILIPFLSKLLRAIIVLISISVILQEFNYNISGLVAGLGIGGLAISLAAQDMIKNFIGGLVIIFEKPFSIGDWINATSVEGTVEDISFRSTLIRTFDQALVTVPNSSLAATNIINYSKMGKRKIDFRIGISYNTPIDKVEQAIFRLREMIQAHEGIHPETILVTFDKLSESSLELFFYFFTKTTVWSEYLEVKQEINLKIIEILNEEGIEIAFPSQTLYITASNKEIIQKTFGTND